MKTKVVELGEISVLINGDRGKNYPSQADIINNGEIPFVNAGHLVENQIDFQQMNYISRDKYEKLSSGKINDGDILYCLRGSLGKKAIVTGINEGAIASSLVIIRPNKELVSSEYLSLALESSSISTQLFQANNGSSQPNLSAKSVREYKIALHNIKEQDEIVTKISTVKKIIDYRKEQLSLLDNLIKSRFVEMFDNISETVPLSYYVKSLTAGKSLAGEEECSNKVLKTGAVSYDYFDATQVKNLPIDHQPLSEHQIKDGDIIISRMNTSELVGAAAYVWEAPDKTFLPDRLWRANLNNNCNPIFVWQSLIQPSTKEQLSRDASGTSGSMKNISKPGLLGIKVKLIPLEQQDIFASVVKQIYKLKVEVQKSLDETQVLFDSLMQEYFE